MKGVSTAEGGKSEVVNIMGKKIALSALTAGEVSSYL